MRTAAALLAEAVVVVAVVAVVVAVAMAAVYRTHDINKNCYASISFNKTTDN